MKTEKQNIPDKNKEEHKPKTSEGVPDGDGGSLEREDANQDSNSIDTEKSDTDTDNLSIPDEGNSLGNDSDNRRQNESIEGSLNAKPNISGDYHIRADFDREFYFSSSVNRTIGCVASLDSQRGYYFKGE